MAVKDDKFPMARARMRGWNIPGLKGSNMRRLISAVALVVLASPALAADAPHSAKEAKEKEPVVGRWMAKEKLGDGSSYGFELKADGKAKAIHTETMRVEAWRRVDKTHIELTEVSEGNHTASRSKVKYEVKINRDGDLELSSRKDGMYKGTFTPAR